MHPPPPLTPQTEKLTCFNGSASISGNITRVSPDHDTTSHFVGGFWIQRQISSGMRAPFSALKSSRTWRSVHRGGVVIVCVIPVRDGLLTRSHGIQLYHHTLDDLVHGFSVLSSPPNLDEKLVERRLILDKSVVHVLYDQQSLLEGFQEIFAVSLSDNTGMGSNHELGSGSKGRTSTSCYF